MQTQHNVNTAQDMTVVEDYTQVDIHSILADFGCEVPVNGVEHVNYVFHMTAGQLLFRRVVG